MKLATRLALMSLGCLVPVLAAQTWSQFNTFQQRRHQIGSLVLRQAAFANADMGTILAGVAQFATVASQFPEIGRGGSDCAERLDALQRGLPQYRFLAVYAPAGSTPFGNAPLGTAPPGNLPFDNVLLCATAGAPPDLATAASTGRASEMLAAKDVAVGQAVAATGQDGKPGLALPVAVRLPRAAATGEARTLLVGLDSGWVSDHLNSARAGLLPTTPEPALYVADSGGNIIGQAPRSEAKAPERLPEWLRPLVARSESGTETVDGPDGRRFLVGFVPSSVPPEGIAVIEAVALDDLTAAIRGAAIEDLAVVGAAAAIALLLAVLFGRRFVVRPTRALLLAARQWQDGDLGARARLPDPGSEFGALAQSFNAMAAGLQARETERRLQASFLESQVAERTRELSESNNRLQVEIAGREKTEAALHQAQKLQAVGQLAGGIAHDFNNMLATVLGNLELMERRVSQAGASWSAPDAERLLTLIERATGAVQRGGQLTSRLLAFSRRQRLAARPTDVNALLRELITLAGSTLGRRVQVVPELDEGLWPAMVDPSQVEAAILNLCLNARDAMPGGGRMTIATSNATVGGGTPAGPADRDLPPGQYVRIRISDTGEGMTAEVKARAFDPFFTTKGPGAGSGLGLSQVYGMARQSGGGVAIESAPDRGTEVILSLPRAQQAESPEAAAPAVRTGLPAGRHGELVLVVDDDHAVREVTVEMARDLGYEVAQASGGEQALAMVEALRPGPRFILLDYAMPGMNGLQLARALRLRGLTAPIALVTGYAELSEADIAAGRLAGLLRKPFTIRELDALLAQLRAGADASLQAGLVDG